MMFVFVMHYVQTIGRGSKTKRAADDPSVLKYSQSMCGGYRREFLKIECPEVKISTSEVGSFEFASTGEIAPERRFCHALRSNKWTGQQK
jgi:hypothetical protein